MASSITENSKGEWCLRSNLQQLVLNKQKATGQKIKQVEIAEATGLNVNTISRWMDPTRTFKMLYGREARALCDFVGCTLNELVEFEICQEA